MTTTVRSCLIFTAFLAALIAIATVRNENARQGVFRGSVSQFSNIGIEASEMDFHKRTIGNLDIRGRRCSDAELLRVLTTAAVRQVVTLNALPGDRSVVSSLEQSVPVRTVKFDTDD